MNVLLLQLDGKLPNLALMRIAAHHRALGDSITLRRTPNAARVPARFGDAFDRVYASAIFSASLNLCLEVERQWPGALIGGTGWNVGRTLEQFGIASDGLLDYTDYPRFPHSIGFTQRGCRLNCGFCVVPAKEGKARGARTIPEIWRGHPWPRNLLLLDNDFFGQPEWRERIREIQDGNFRVSFTQGINARFLTDETAQAVGSIPYYDDDFEDRRIYTAWDNRKDEQRLFDGLGRLVKYGVRPDQIMVYMLIGYWPGENHADREYRRAKLRDFGARPYPMPYQRTQELVGFQRWVIRRLDLKMPWSDYAAANFRPEKVRSKPPTFPLLEVVA